MSCDLRPLDRYPLQAFLTDSQQVAGWLEQILAQLPPGHLRIMQSTFSISEEFLRRMYYIRKDRDMHLSVIIDRKALQKTVNLWRMVSMVYDAVYVASNHSKLMTVSDGDRHVTMLTSQNLTRDNRYESTVITSDLAAFNDITDSLNYITIRQSAPLHELMPTQDDPTQGATLAERIERMASYFVPISDMAVILEIDPHSLRERITDSDSEEARAYMRGKAKSRIALRAQEMELARVGSPMGMNAVRDNLASMELDEI